MNAALVLMLALPSVLAPPPPPPPHVVKSIPADHASAVAPGVQTLVFVFDQPMMPDRFSVTTIGDSPQPEFVGPPTFSRDGKTFSIDVRLRPATDYAVGANSERYRNFVGVNGLAAAPLSIRFTTAP